jgi:hypothetical protein
MSNDEEDQLDSFDFGDALDVFLDNSNFSELSAESSRATETFATSSVLLTGPQDLSTSSYLQFDESNKSICFTEENFEAISTLYPSLHARKSSDPSPFCKIGYAAFDRGSNDDSMTTRYLYILSSKFNTP